MGFLQICEVCFYQEKLPVIYHNLSVLNKYASAYALVAQWLASQNAGTTIRDRFPGGEVANLLFNFFEDSNE